MCKFKTALLFLLIIAMAVPAALAYDLPYVIGVDKTNQITTVYDNKTGAIVRQMICSTAPDSIEYTYKLTHDEKEFDRKDWYYIPAFHMWVKYATRIVDSIMFHSVPYFKQNEATIDTDALSKMGTAASHGCIRLYWPDAQFIAENCAPGTKVRIYSSGKRDEFLRSMLLEKSYTGENGQTYEQYLGMAQNPDDLGYKSTGEEVSTLQTRLKALGQYSGEVSGTYDANTVIAVRAVQTLLGLDPTGIADPSFRQTIQTDVVPIGLNATLYTGDSGPAVEQLQQKLTALKLYSGAINGTMDAATMEAVNLFRAAYAWFPAEKADAITQKAAYYEAGKVAAQFAMNSDYSVDSTVEDITFAVVSYDGTVRIRQKPNTDADTVTRVSKGDYLIVEEDNGGWYKVRAAGGTGYIRSDLAATSPLRVAQLRYIGADDGRTYSIGYAMSDYLKGTKRPCVVFENYLAGGGSLDDQEGLSEFATVVTPNDAALNLREKPDSESTALTTISAGEVLRVIAHTGDWVRVLWNDQTGYVQGKYLTFTMAPADTMLGGTEAQAQSASLTAKINAADGKAPVYDSDAEDGKELGHLSNGTEVQVTDVTNGWCAITLKGHSGYMKEDDLIIEY